MASKRGGLLTLKDMTAGSGCTPRTVRYYEREGLLQAARSSGGHRLFPPGELDRLNFILALREAGVSDQEVIEALAHVALKAFTNAVALVAQTEIDFPKQPRLPSA